MSRKGSAPKKPTSQPEDKLTYTLPAGTECWVVDECFTLEEDVEADFIDWSPEGDEAEFTVREYENRLDCPPSHFTVRRGELPQGVLDAIGDW